ncbi:hypothetical protein AB205_0201840 [Aquarana catesbeiana]|uniref:Uncharacterized protein n=1 Tax=Aquarana catesbeiana TaxID=8400 RepID=A0A2G9RQA8_AQUCT|nr:hypothetical protein AB205_0201840 [Aquarana catesbeiana]
MRREMPQSQQEEDEEDVVEIVTTGDRDVVDEGHFSESAQILIGEIIRTWKTSSKTSMMFKTK